jgi:DNA topoisomerase-1
MQQDASTKLGYTLKKVTSLAQELYEGVNIENEGKVALVTYIRTDSVRVSPEAINMAKNYIINKYGDKYYPKTPNFYKSKATSQDAHEAIRPISLDRTPEKVKPFISADNYKLYKLIYERFLTSQMAEATYDSVIVEIENSKYTFKASGKTPIFDGFLVVTNANKKAKTNENNDEESDESENDKLPELNENDVLGLIEIKSSQKFTKAPSRYTEATLVKEMEEKGIGRPATYTPTITLLASRNYTEKEGKSLKPTQLGEKVSEMLEKYFKSIINVKFTADMENKLDEIASNGIEWRSIVSDFYKDFVVQLNKADSDNTRFKLPPTKTDEVCDKCGSPMVIRTGRYGEFLACSNYPACKNIKSINKAVANCPKCGKAVYERKSKTGKTFYGCSGYPKCDFVSWDMPLNEKCPKCNSYLAQKNIYGNLKIKCSNSSCDYERIEKKQNKITNEINENQENN